MLDHPNESDDPFEGLTNEELESMADARECDAVDQLQQECA